MFSGSMVALVTPMTKDGAIDYQALQNLVDFHVENGTNAIVSVGTTGESATLDFKEHAQVIKKTVEAANKRLPVIAGTGANSTKEAIHLSQSAKDVGADACLLVCPYYNKPTQEGLYQHHKQIAQTVAIPQILYNVPGRTAVDMLPSTVARIAELEHIIGIKEASGCLSRMQDLLAAVDGKIAVYSGDDATARESILLGAKGDISVTANVAPKKMAQMCAAALAGNGELAAEIDADLELLHLDLFVESNPIPAKWALAKMGLIKNSLRLPMTKLSKDNKSAVLAAMNLAGVL